MDVTPRLGTLGPRDASDGEYTMSEVTPAAVERLVALEELDAVALP